MAKKKRVSVWRTRGDNVCSLMHVVCYLEKLTLGDLVDFVEEAEYIGVNPEHSVMFGKDFSKRWYCSDRSIAFYVDSSPPESLGEEVIVSHRIYCPLYSLNVERLREFTNKALEHGCSRDAPVFVHGRTNMHPLDYAWEISNSVDLE